MEDIMIGERNVLKFKPSKITLDFINKNNLTKDLGGTASTEKITENLIYILNHLI